METEMTHSQKFKYWWIVSITGMLSVIFGFWIFMNPVISYFGLAMYFSIFFILLGVSEIINAFTGRQHRSWGWGFTMGILDFVIGFILLSHLAWAADILPYIVAFILMFKSIDFIGYSTAMKAEKLPGWGWLLAGGILTLIFSFLIIFHPLFGVFNIIVWTGLAFIFGGISAIVYSFMVRK